MTTWIVTEIAEVHRYYRVDAETAGEAELMVLAGDVSPRDESVMSSHVDDVTEATASTEQ